MGSDSRVRGADSGSTAAILPGPVQAWPRPGPARPRPRRRHGRRSSATHSGLLCNCRGLAPPIGGGSGRGQREAPPTAPPARARAVESLCALNPGSSRMRELCTPEVAGPTQVPKLARPGPPTAFVPKFSASSPSCEILHLVSSKASPPISR